MTRYDNKPAPEPVCNNYIIHPSFTDVQEVTDGCGNTQLLIGFSQGLLAESLAQAMVDAIASDPILALSFSQAISGDANAMKELAAKIISPIPQNSLFIATDGLIGENDAATF